jgi:uncharacterized repeat protein (TIGR01451 family)
MKHGYALLLAGLVPLCGNAITISGNVTAPNCGQANGCITLFVTGGTPPYAYLWAPVPANGQGTPNVCGLLAGTWMVTVTDAMAQEATQSFTLIDQGLNVFNALTYVYGPEAAAHHPCTGQQEGSFRVMQDMLGGTPPYTITANGQPPLFIDPVTNDPVFGYYFPFESVSVEVTDANGCTGGGQMFMDGINPTSFAADNIDPACGGQANGSAELTIGYSGPYGPFVTVTGPGGGAVFSGDPFGDPLILNELEPGLYTVQRIYNPVYMASQCQFDDQFTIPDLGVACGTVSGEVFIDNDQDCVHDGSEVAVPYRVLTITPGPEYAITDGSGHYTRNVADGNHTIIPQGTDLYPICPVVQPVSFTINGDAAIIDFADSSLIQLDIAINSGATPARVGFIQTLWAHVSNSSAQLSGPVTVSLTFDPQMTFTSALPTPANVSGNQVTWTFPAFGVYASADLNVQLQVPADINLLGQPYAHMWSVDQPIAESSLANNAWSNTGIITAAYDPNDKTARTSTGSSNALYFIGQDEWIDYTIRFQNTGTASAIDVVVTDTLAPELDMATFEQGAASHPFEVRFKPGRVVEWRFTDILLPDSNVNEAASHGLVNFRIRPAQPLLPGTEIRNTANIYFDFNPPVITEPSVLIAEFSTGTQAEGPGEVGKQLTLFPNPVTDALQVIIGDAGAGAHTADVLSMDGRLVMRIGAISRYASISTASLAAGVYVLRLRDADGRTQQAPFMKH